MNASYYDIDDESMMSDDDELEAALENFEQHQEPAENINEGTLAIKTSERKETRCKPQRGKQAWSSENENLEA